MIKQLVSGWKMSNEPLTPFEEFNIWLQGCPTKVKEYEYKLDSIIITFDMKLKGGHEE